MCHLISIVYGAGPPNFVVCGDAYNIRKAIVYWRFYINLPTQWMPLCAFCETPVFANQGLLSPPSYLLHLTLVADLIRENILFVQYLSKSRCMKSRKELDVASRTVARTLADALRGASPVGPHRKLPARLL